MWAAQHCSRLFSSTLNRLCVFYACNQQNVLGKLTIRHFNNWVIQKLLLEDLAETQYTRDDEGLYSRINLRQHRDRVTL